MRGVTPARPPALPLPCRASTGGGFCDVLRPHDMKRIILIASFAATAAIAAVAPQPLDAQQPVLADIMSGTQFRHLKLAYSGKVKNWQLADYELGRIQQSFADAAQLYPVFKNIPLAELIKSESEPPLADLRKS